MMRLFKIEWAKTWNYNVFRILGIIYVASFLISIIILPFIQVKTQMTADADILDIKSFYTFPIIWDSYAYLAGKSNLFLAIIVIFLIGNEYSFRTFRQHIIDGLSRDELLIGKLVVIGFIALLNTVLIFVFGWVFGLIYSSGYTFSDTISNLYMLGIYFIQAVSYMVLALFLTIWLRNKTLSMVVLLIYSLIVEPIIRLVVNKYVMAKLGLYFPIKVITRLTPIPENGIVEFIKVNAEVNGIGGSLPLGINLIMAIGYSVVFYIIARQIILKRDL
jgi:ABC-2 type transport system permease protein